MKKDTNTRINETANVFKVISVPPKWAFKQKSHECLITCFYRFKGIHGLGFSIKQFRKLLSMEFIAQAVSPPEKLSSCRFLRSRCPASIARLKHVILRFSLQ